jgi:hypothetical protein
MLRKPARARYEVSGTVIAVLALLFVSLPAFAEEGIVDTAVPDQSVAILNQFGFSATLPDDVRKAAETGVYTYLESIPARDLQHYSFPPGSGFHGITLGAPYRVMTIHPQSLFNASGDEDIRTLLKPTGMWFFPILQDGEPRAILTVGLLDGQWQAVAVGRSGLAEQLHQMEERWSDDKGFVRILVRIFQATSDVLIIVTDDVVQTVPFESARISLELDDIQKGAMEPYSTADIIQRLIVSVRDNLIRNSEEGGRR